MRLNSNCRKHHTEDKKCLALKKGAETLLSFDQQRAGKKNRCTVSALTGKLVYQEFRMAN